MLHLSALFVCHLSWCNAYFKHVVPEIMRIDAIGLDFYSWRGIRGRSLLELGTVLQMGAVSYPCGRMTKILSSGLCNKYLYRLTDIAY